MSNRHPKNLNLPLKQYIHFGTILTAYNLRHVMVL